MFNVEPGETDVNTLFSLLRKAPVPACKETHGRRKNGEQLRSVLDYSLIKKTFGWKPSVIARGRVGTYVEFFKKD